MDDEVLNRVTVEQQLARLEPESRTVLSLVFKIDQPTDWVAPWPPTYAAIGVYIGLKFRNRPLSEAAIRYIRDEALAELRGERPDGRRRKRK